MFTLQGDRMKSNMLGIDTQNEAKVFLVGVCKKAENAELNFNAVNFGHSINLPDDVQLINVVELDEQNYKILNALTPADWTMLKELLASR
jgi:hypothetical protein